jgi:succinoglycan biosynthesis transport protein ExoP
VILPVLLDPEPCDGLWNPGRPPAEEVRLLGELTQRLVISRSERAEAEARLRRVEQLLASDTSLEAAAQIVDSSVLDDLRTREIELAQQIQELSAEYGDRHPRMVSLRNELEGLQARKEEEIRQVALQLRDEVKALRSVEASLQAKIEQFRRLRLMPWFPE